MGGKGEARGRRWAARASLPPDGTCREKAWRVPVPLGVPHASDTRLTPTQVSGGRRSVGLGLWEKLLIHCSPQQWRGGLGSPRRTAAGISLATASPSTNWG